MGHLEQLAVDFIRSVYSAIGWPGVVVLMVVESAAIPIPSEIIIPFAAWFLVADHGLGIGWVFLLGFLGAIGNLGGALFLYWIGMVGARPAIDRWGRYLMMSPSDLDRAERWFDRYGDRAIFVSRILPVARTFMSFPAGAARMNIAKFSFYTLVGSFPFATGLAYGGYLLGENWATINQHANVVTIIVALLIVGGIVWFLWRRRAAQLKKS